MAERIYAAIDLKSFYASVECVDRGLDPVSTNLARQTKAAQKRRSALPCHPRSNPTVFPDVRGFLRSWRG